MISYNIYYGTIGKKFGVKYQITKNFKNEQDAKKFAKELASSFYYKNEGKCGLPSYKDIQKEAEYTGLSLAQLYEDHINDMMRWYAIPTDCDTVSKAKLKM